MQIYCPKCRFEPTPDVLWTCRPGCGHAWHTFLTQGQCPNCFKKKLILDYVRSVSITRRP